MKNNIIIDRRNSNLLHNGQLFVFAQDQSCFQQWIYKHFCIHDYQSRSTIFQHYQKILDLLCHKQSKLHLFPDNKNGPVIEIVLVLQCPKSERIKILIYDRIRNCGSQFLIDSWVVFTWSLILLLSVTHIQRRHMYVYNVIDFEEDEN